MNLSEFDYELPENLIAQHPPENRDGARMLVVHRDTGAWEDRVFRDLPEFLVPGDCVVLNDSRVIPSRLFGRRPGKEARIEIFLVRPCSGENPQEWTALVRPGRKVRKGDLIEFEGGLQAEVTEWGEMGERTIHFINAPDIYERLEKIGHIPLPPYIHRPDEAEDRERYQTVYAHERGSVAAPTAGLHFTEAVLAHIRTAGAEIARATLHVGLGTFQPIHVEQIEDHQMHYETYSIHADEWKKVASARRVLGIGTTSVRTIESVSHSGKLSGETNLFIYPGYEFRRVNAMLTNFHLPRTSLLLLVCALAGKELTLAAYRHAVEQSYRFFSYGDCMLIL
jgi:S-adenosylmethionine:tRNA ribosyltransferase-isomerase